MTEARKLPQWKSHKIVGAFRIDAIVHRADGTAELHAPADESVAPVHVSAHWLGRNEPRVGGYFVQYENDYTSYSPGSVFESGYSRIYPTDEPHKHAPKG
jgi:hypothetical protein